MAEPTALTRVVVRNMLVLRRLRGWSAQRLADELAVAGYPISRAQLANQESGRAQHITVDQLLALARVFGMSIEGLTTDPACPACGQAIPAETRTP